MCFGADIGARKKNPTIQGHRGDANGRPEQLHARPPARAALHLFVVQRGVERNVPSEQRKDSPTFIEQTAVCNFATSELRDEVDLAPCPRGVSLSRRVRTAAGRGIVRRARSKMGQALSLTGPDAACYRPPYSISHRGLY